MSLTAAAAPPKRGTPEAGVANPDNLPHLRIGDTVLVTYTEALAIAVEELPKPPDQGK